MTTLTMNKYLTRFPASRFLFYWVTQMFNRVDPARVKLVGPDRACAEWLLRNGAAVKWVGESKFLTDYNALAPLEGPQPKIQAVDATNSAISDMGFPHFRDCKHIEEMKLINCFYIEDEGLHHLSLIKDSLNHLEIINCGNIGQDALNHVAKLSKLKLLRLGNLPLVKNKTQLIENISKAIPDCQIDFH